MPYTDPQKAKECKLRWAERNREQTNSRARTRARDPETKAKRAAYYQSRREYFLAKANSNYDAQREVKKAASAKYYWENREKCLAYHRILNAKITADPVLVEKRRLRMRKWLGDYRNDERIRIVNRLRARVRHALMNQQRTSSTMELLGMGLQEFRDYFQSLFTEDMNWDLFMAGKIDIDHIRPMASFDLSDPEQQMQACHWSNLQPLLSIANRRKGANWNGVNFRGRKKNIAIEGTSPLVV